MLDFWSRWKAEDMEREGQGRAEITGRTFGFCAVKDKGEIGGVYECLFAIILSLSPYSSNILQQDFHLFGYPEFKKCRSFIKSIKNFNRYYSLQWNTVMPLVCIPSHWYSYVSMINGKSWCKMLLAL